MIHDVGISILSTLQPNLSEAMPEQPAGSQVRNGIYG